MVRGPHQNTTATPPRKYGAHSHAADGTNRSSVSSRRRRNLSRKPVPPLTQQSEARQRPQLTIRLGHAPLSFGGAWNFMPHGSAQSASIRRRLPNSLRGVGDLAVSSSSQFALTSNGGVTSSAAAKNTAG
jgi:hypothetical protein